MSEPLGPSEIADLRKMLQSFLDAIEREELTTSTATRYRLEGAVTSLTAVLGEDASRLAELLANFP